MPACFVARSDQAIEIELVAHDELAARRDSLPQPARRWIDAQRFRADPGQCCIIPRDDGGIGRVLVGLGDGTPDTYTLADLPASLPVADYCIATKVDAERAYEMAVGWGLGGYRFDRYRTFDEGLPRLVIGEDSEQLTREVEALYLVRDLINTAPNDMMPVQLSAAAEALAERHGGHFRSWVGDELLAANHPTIHMVGRASVHAPRLIELRWGDAGDPAVTLVGKGVCFDTGGLDLKPANAMRLMQKDMGGAAHVLGLASMVMAARLPVNLRVLIPAVDNAVSGDAFRPGDVVKTRKGLTVEVDNTDAEGRLVLCDALAAACEEPPDLLIDFATLTGAARSAVGTGIAAFFSTSDTLAEALMQSAERRCDPVWRLPLHRPYERLLKSRRADLVNCASSPYAGAIVAALFLQRFVDDGIDWLHFDMMAWNVSSTPGRPEGGEAMGVRAAFDLLRSKFD